MPETGAIMAAVKMMFIGYHLTLIDINEAEDATRLGLVALGWEESRAYAAVAWVVDNR